MPSPCTEPFRCDLRGRAVELFEIVGREHDIGCGYVLLQPRRSKETNTMQITRNNLETGRGPSEWFTGAVFIDTVAAPSDVSRISASSVHFTPGARTAWHTHPNGQTIWVTEGAGLCQRRGGPIEVIRPGDRVFFEAEEEHWHGATPTRFMTHLALLEVGEDGTTAAWGDHVSDSEYAAAPAVAG